MTHQQHGPSQPTDEELRTVVGGRSFWGTVKAVGRWIKNHIGFTNGTPVVKGTHNVGGG